MQKASDDTEGPKEAVTARIKISGPEQSFAYILHLCNYIVGAVAFTLLMHNFPQYAEAIKKVEDASGFSMPTMIYYVCPAAFLLGIITKITYHSTSETWKVIGSKKKWTKQQLAPKPRSDFVLEEIPLQESQTPETVPAEVNEMLEFIHDRKN